MGRFQLGGIVRYVTADAGKIGFVLLTLKSLFRAIILSPN